MNYYPRHIGDYLKDTAHLSLLEHGIYGRLLDVYYSKEGPIDAAQIERLICVRTDEERSALRDVLNEFFQRDGECYRHARCDREIAVMQEKQSKAQASAAKRWDKERSNANAMPTQCERNANALLEQHTEGNAPNTNTNTKDKRGAARSALPARPYSVGEQVWNDWLALRAKKRAPVTATVLRSAESEAGKAGMPLEEFLRVWCARGSQGLEAEWLKPKAQTLRAEPAATVPMNPSAVYVPPPPLTAEEREAAELARQRAMQAINRRQAA